MKYYRRRQWEERLWTALFFIPSSVAILLFGVLGMLVSDFPEPTLGLRFLLIFSAFWSGLWTGFAAVCWWKLR